MSCWEILVSEQRDQHSFNSDLDFVHTAVRVHTVPATSSKPGESNTEIWGNKKGKC